MALLKLNDKQLQLLKNDPLHYHVSTTWDHKEGCYICECDPSTANKIKKIVDN